MNCTSDDIKKLGTILGVWAHPDDESWCMGGIMACAAANGQRVVCVTATRGDAGKTADEARWPKALLGEIREKELAEALKELGVKEHIWLDYKDGKLAEADADAASDEIAAIISEFKPDTIFSFGPDGLTGHPDHCAVYEWTRTAIKKAGSSARFLNAVEIAERYNLPLIQKCDEVFDIYFNTDKPKTVPIRDIDFYYELSEEVKSKKVESLRLQACQTADMFANPIGRQYMNLISESEAFMDDFAS